MQVQRGVAGDEVAGAALKNGGTFVGEDHTVRGKRDGGVFGIALVGGGAFVVSLLDLVRAAPTRVGGHALSGNCSPKKVYVPIA